MKEYRIAFVSVHVFIVENNNKYNDFLNKELCFSIEKNSKEAILFLEAITTPAFSKKYNESNNVKNKIKIMMLTNSKEMQ